MTDVPLPQAPRVVSQGEPVRPSRSGELPPRGKMVLIAALLGFSAFFSAAFFFAFSASESPVGAGWYLFSYAMGVTMIVLPCTFPLAFVIVPMAMGKSPRKGITMALSFSIGVAVTLSMYGVLTAWLGDRFLEETATDIEFAKNAMYLVAGVFAYLFALGELGFVRFRMPTYSGAAPMFIQRRRDISKALFLGLFMGNIGIGCPHPATPVILSRIAVSGDIFYGWLLFFVHALGRITPLLLLALLAILGVNALSWVVKRRTQIERATGWAMVFVAAFILVLGLFTHDWWVNSGQHTLLESLTQEERFLGIISGRIGADAPHTHGPEEGPGMFGLPLWLGNWALVLLWVAPLWWYLRRRSRAMASLPSEERVKEERALPWVKSFVVALSLLLAAVFIWALPQNFLKNAAVEEPHDEGAQDAHGMHEGPAGRIAMRMTTDPAAPAAGDPALVRLTFPETELHDFSLNHERLVHAVIVRAELQTFAHFHPEPVADSPAAFEFTHVFSKSGRYLVAINTVHGGEEVVADEEIRVSGSDPETVARDFRREAAFDGYDVSLETDPAAPRAGSETRLRWTIRRNVSPVVDLEPYLGAAMHIVIVPEDLSSLIHTHGEMPGTDEPHSGFVQPVFAHGDEEEGDFSDAHGELPDAFGPTIEARAVFPETGLYAVFGEFRHEGRVLVTRFLVDVIAR